MFEYGYINPKTIFLEQNDNLVIINCLWQFFMVLGIFARIFYLNSNNVQVYQETDGLTFSICFT